MRVKILLGLCITVFFCTAQATLIDRSGGMIYDDVLDVTWLSDANLGGSMNWNASMIWADNLIFGGFDDWRLASMDVNGDHVPSGVTNTGIVDCNTASEMDCRDNELGYMFYQNFMGSFGDTLTGNQGLFTNIQPAHWSGTQLATNPQLATWRFNFDFGSQAQFPQTFSAGAWAVRSGDVRATVPEPGMLALLGLGLAGFGLSRTRRAAKT